MNIFARMSVAFVLCFSIFILGCDGKNKNSASTSASNSSNGGASESILSQTDSVENPMSILILGDSLTEGYGVAKENAFPTQLEKRLLTKFPNKTTKIINAGSSGSTSASAFSRLQWHLKSKPDILFLALGANDGLRGFSVETTKSNLQKTISLAKENNIRVIIAGMQLPLNYGNKFRKDFAAIFPTLAKENDIKLVPFLLKDVGGKAQFNLSDGIHPNEAGHKIIADNLVPYLEDFY